MFGLPVSFVRGDWTRVHRDQLASLARATPAAMAGYGLNVVIAVVAFRGVIPGPELAVWAVTALAISTIVGVRALRRPLRSKDHTPGSPMKSTWGAWLFALLLGLPWGVLGAHWAGEVASDGEVILMALVTGMAASGSVLLAPVPLAAVIYASTILLPLVIKCLVVLGGHYAVLGALALSFLIFLTGLIASNAQLFLERLEAISQLKLSVVALNAAREETERVAMTDGLTNVANRRAFMAQLNALAIRGDTPLDCGIFYVDLDRFKGINDTLGHAVGDALLRHVAARIGDSVRHGDLVARLGGDEFVVVARGIGDRPTASALAERLVEALSEPYQIEGQKLQIGACVGVALASESHVEGDSLLKQADLAMYAAKNAGRGCYCIFEPDMQRSAEERRALEMGLRSAIANGELELFYQPIRRLPTGEISGFECLMRWRHPTRGVLPPTQFLEIADDIGIADEIGSWVITEACRQAREWPSDIVVGINLSPLQIKSGNIKESVEDALDASGLPASRLEIEITETSLLESDAETVESLRRLQEIGVSIALDDFGAGYSSLSYLVSFPFNRIKIDRLFISELGRSRQSDLIIRSVAKLARSLHCSVVAEGIETEEQRQRLLALNVSHGQGFLLGRPLPAAETTKLLEAERETRFAESA